GMRNFEVRATTWDRVSLADNHIRVLGKRSKERLVPIHPELRKRLVGRVWCGGSPYVCPGAGGRMLSPSGVHGAGRRIWGRDVQPHDWRRTVATSLRANGVDRWVRDAIM